MARTKKQQAQERVGPFFSFSSTRSSGRTPSGSNSTRSSSRKSGLQEKAAATKEWNLNTRVDASVLEHYNSYPRKSPAFRPAVGPENFVIVNYSTEIKMPRLKPGKRVNETHTTRPLPPFLPSSVILFVTMHGRTKEPFITPVNVERHIATDFGSCNALFLKELGIKPMDLVKPGFKKKEKKTGEFIKRGILSAVEENRKYAEAHLDAGSETTKRFLESKHHGRPKTFQKNAPMFNKEYTLEQGADTGIWVRADLPLDSLVKDVLFELRTVATTLQHILLFLAERGVQDVTLFDLSCQPDNRESIHRTRYGGARLK